MFIAVCFTGDTSGWATLFGTVHGDANNVALTQECCKWYWFEDSASALRATLFMGHGFIWVV